MVFGKVRGLSVEQKDLPAGAGGLAPPFYFYLIETLNFNNQIKSQQTQAKNGTKVSFIHFFDL